MHNASEIPFFKSGCYDVAHINTSGFKRLLRKSWKEHFGNKCQCCGKVMVFNNRDQHSRDYATIDHIIARGLGGKNEPENIQIICLDCNKEKAEKERELCPKE